MRFAHAKSIGLRRLAYGGGGASASEQLLTLATDDGWTALYDPTNPDTRTLRADGADNYISAISDGLGNFPDFVQSTASAQFRLLAGEFGSLDAAEGGAGRLMDQASASNISQPTHYITVMQSDVVDSDDAIVAGTNTTRQQLRRRSSGNYGLFAGTEIVGGTLDTAAHVLSARVNEGGSYLREDATQIASGNAGVNSTATMRWGTAPGGGQDFVGPLGLLVIKSGGAPSDAERDRMEDLIHSLTGIAKA